METKEKKIFNWRPIFYSFLILLLAISSARFIFVGNVSYIVPVCVVFVVLFVVCFVQKKFKHFFVLLGVFCFGLGWFFVGVSSFESKEYLGECEVVGRVSDDITYSEYENSLSTVLKSVKVNGEKTKNIRLTINFGNREEIKIGDVISFSAELSNVKLFEIGAFNSFYYRDNVAYESEVSTASLHIIENKMTFDEKIRQSVKKNLYANMSEENAAVAYGVLFGDKTDISDDTIESYKTAGVIHLLTVSGLHISFLIGLICFILKKCRVKGWLNFAICAVIIVLYAYICGFSPSVLRSGIMGLVLMGATLSGKRYDNLNSLGIAGILILLFKPLYAMDIGFLMSFFCVLSIFVLFPVVSEVFRKFLPKKIADAFSLSLCAQIGVLPFALEIGAVTNYLSPFANLLIIPIFSVVYPTLFVGALLTLVMPFLGFILTCCGWGFSLIFSLASFFGQTKLIADYNPMSVIIIAICVMFCFAVSRLFMASRKTKMLCCAFLLCLASVVAVTDGIGVKPQTSLSVCFNYSNEVVLLTNNNGESVIIDVGYESFTKKLLRNQNVESVSTIFVLQNSRVKIDTAREIGVQTIIRTGSGEGYEEEMLVEKDEAGLVNGFAFKYRTYDDLMIGLEISYDNLKIFVARERYTTPEDFEEIWKEEFDVVIVGKKTEFAENFVNADEVVGYYQDKNVSSSYARDGNVEFVLKDNKFLRRCLD